MDGPSSPVNSSGSAVGRREAIALQRLADHSLDAFGNHVVGVSRQWLGERHQALDRLMTAFRVNGGDHQAAGQRGLAGLVGGVLVADLANQHQVGAGPQRAQQGLAVSA